MSSTLQAPPGPGALLTAEQYAALPDDGRETELVRGKIVEMPRPGSSHGYYCINIAAVLREYVREHELGRVVGNDSGVITERGPDTVRGPDVAFHSYAKVPKGPLPSGYWPTPELVFEVLSPGNRKAEMTAKVAEYHLAGVLVVCVLDPELGMLAVYPQEEFPRRYTADEELSLPEVFPDFRVPVRRFLD